MSEKIPKGWKWVKLGDVVIINPNETLKKGIIAKKVPMEALHPFTKKVKFFAFEKYNGGVKFKNGDTLVARITPSLENGKTVYVDLLDDDEIGFGSTEFIVLREKSGITDKQFVYYFAISNDFRDIAIKSMTGSSGRQRVQNEVVKEFEFPLPPLPEQKAIAEVLSSIDDKIDLLHRQNKTLEEMAMALFRKWFIDPTKDGLPEGWEERKLKDIYFLEKGIEPGSKNYLETPSIDSIRFIRVGDMLDNKANVYIQKDLVGNSTCKFDDLLVSFDGTVGRVSFGIEGCYSSGIRKIYSKDEIYNKLWLKHQIFVSEDIQDEINMYAEGTTILHASSSIEYLSFPFPPKEKIEEYDKFFDPIYKKMLHNKKSIQTLEKLRDTLLPKLMSGEVRVMKKK
jgi:type I restriction enzyme S subunit